MNPESIAYDSTLQYIQGNQEAMLPAELKELLRAAMEIDYSPEQSTSMLQRIMERIEKGE